MFGRKEIEKSHKDFEKSFKRTGVAIMVVWIFIALSITTLITLAITGFYYRSEIAHEAGSLIHEIKQGAQGK